MWRERQKSEQEVRYAAEIEGHRGGTPPPALAGVSGLPTGGDALAETYRLNRGFAGNGVVWESRKKQELMESPQMRAWWPQGSADNPCRARSWVLTGE